MMRDCLKRRLMSVLLVVAVLLGWSQIYTVGALSQEVQVASPQVSVGNGFMVALNSYGQAYAWGDNSYGTLGNETKVNSSTPVAVSMPQDTVFTKVTAGWDHVLALSSTGQVYAWGANGNGQLATGNTEDVTKPQRIETLPTDKIFVSVAAGKCFSMALASDGTVYVWGLNDKAQLGISPLGFAVRREPQVIPALSGLFVTGIFAGEATAAIVTTDGSLWLWGDNSGGQVDPSGASYALPREKTSQSVYFASSVAIGKLHVSFSELNGSVKSFGVNQYGQFGNGNAPGEIIQASLKAATLAEGVTVKSIAVGDFHTIALSGEGKVYTWGANNATQLGFVSDQTHQLTPYEITVPYDASERAAWVDACGNASVVIDSSGFVWTFGDNTYGQLGNGSLVPSVTAVSVVGENGSGRLCLGIASRKDVYNVSITATASIPAPSYAVTIPATLSVGTLRQKDADASDRISSTEFSLTVGDVENLFGEKKIAVDVSTASGVFELSDGDHKLSYSLYKEGSETPLACGDRFSEFVSAGTVKGYVKIDRSAITRKGDYSGTLLFTFSVLPVETEQE